MQLTALTPDERDIVPIKISVKRSKKTKERGLTDLGGGTKITLPFNLGGTAHQIVLHENISVDSIKVALWKQVPDLWQGPDRQDYCLYLRKTNVRQNERLRSILNTVRAECWISILRSDFCSCASTWRMRTGSVRARTH